MAKFVPMLFRLLAIINLLFVFVIIFVERRKPAVTWAWIMVISFVPYIGFILYLILGLDSRKHAIFLLKARKDEELFENFIGLDYSGLEFIKEQEHLINRKNVLQIKGSKHLNDMVYLNYKAGLGAFTTNNALTLFHEGHDKFEALIQDINNAEKFIHLQYYIFRKCAIGEQVLAALERKAREGVEVCLFIDGMGCSFTPKSIFKPLTKAGGNIAIFLPPGFIRVNYRNHRKIAVIDGKIGYVGGLNVGDEYLGKKKRFGYWRDSHIRIYGDGVKQLELRFIMDWNFAKKSHPIRLAEKYFPHIEDTVKTTSMQIVSSGPDTKYSSVHHGYSKMIFEANHSIYIATPYFVPDDTIFKALTIAALSGIDVRIMIPANPDHLFVYWASLSYLGSLLDAGVKCYEYEKGFIHSKLMMIDSTVTSVGTANMDVRSFELNFEVNAFIYDTHITKAYEKVFLSDLEDCAEITKRRYDERSNLARIKESISRLISPLL